MYEYMHVTGQDMVGLATLLTTLGSVGWRAVEFGTGAAFTAVVERRVEPWPSLGVKHGAWGPDPTGRFAQRHWDGLRWTEHVIDEAGTQSTDWPIQR